MIYLEEYDSFLGAKISEIACSLEKGKRGIINHMGDSVRRRIQLLN